MEYPITFNPVKHHLGYILERINECRQNKYSTEHLANEIKMIGASTLDLYTGDLKILQIEKEIYELLEKQELDLRSNYFRWIEKNKNYVIFKLSDKSKWTLRKGEDPAYFIHIHPARYSRFSRRVHANSLKSGIMVIALALLEKNDPFDRDFVNKIRNEYLNLPIIKKIDENTGLGKVLTMFRKRLTKTF